MVSVGPSVSGGRVKLAADGAADVLTRLIPDSNPEGVPVTLVRARFAKEIENIRQQLRSASDFW